MEVATTRLKSVVKHAKAILKSRIKQIDCRDLTVI